MFEYHLSFSNGLFYTFAFDNKKRLCGHFKSIDFYDVVDWIINREGISPIEPYKDDEKAYFTVSYFG